MLLRLEALYSLRRDITATLECKSIAGSMYVVILDTSASLPALLTALERSSVSFAGSRCSQSNKLWFSK